MTKKKYFDVNIALIILILYEIEALTGYTVAALIGEVRQGGKLSDLIWAIVIGFVERVQNEGVEMVITAAAPAVLYKWAKRSIGRTHLFTVGPLRVYAL